MTAATIYAVVERHLDYEAQPSPETADDRKPVVSRLLREWTGLVPCIVRRQTVVATSGTLDVGALPLPVVEPVAVFAAGAVLRDPRRKPGPITRAEFDVLNAAAPPGTPIYWTREDAKRLRVWPRAAVGVVVEVEGVTLHPALANDATPLEIPEEELGRAARFCAGHILLPRSAGGSRERALDLIRESSAAAADAAGASA